MKEDNHYCHFKLFNNDRIELHVWPHKKTKLLLHYVSPICFSASSVDLLFDLITKHHIFYCLSLEHIFYLLSELQTIKLCIVLNQQYIQN
uniref:Uncharacterized protein n=1 Tax=Gastroclonium compressum TaxID=1852973 RepID=A0A173FZX9_GASCM|nr:hypothetical protein [Coeloseira compressa]ANH09584.1 hypothetical protein [Coeloseira compressa]